MKYLKINYKLFESEINDIIEKCNAYNIKNYEIDDDGLLTVIGDVDIRLKLNKLPLNFKEIYGTFDVSYSKIKSLKGSPEIVHRDFLFNNTLIKDLKYCPREIHGSIYGSYNKNLKYFIEFPEYVGKSIIFSYCKLNSLYKCIDNINNNFHIFDNNLLKTLKYGPQNVYGDYVCSDCDLTTFYGAPKYIGGDFICNNNKITSFKHAPNSICGDLIIWNNNIRTFYYFPDYVGGKIYCGDNPIYEIWKLFEDKNQIEYFNIMKIISDENKINIKRLNLFLKSIGKEPVKNVGGYVNI